MTPTASSPRERILAAALELLEKGGVEAASTRAVSAAAEVQPPTIYRHFGDMQGLLGAVASAGFTVYLRDKTAPVGAGDPDPVEELREVWARHVAFGLAHPHLFRLMFGAPRPGALSPAALESAAVMRALLQRVAQTGRLAVEVDRATAMVCAAANGVTFSLLGDQTKDPDLSNPMLGAVLTAILTPEAPALGGSARRQAAAHAVSLVALLPELPAPLSEAEEALLVEWLRRLV